MNTPGSSPRRSRLRVRGYTLVELMMALAVFSVGVTGIAAMQKVTTSSNSHAKNLAVASYIAQSWLDRLAIDATIWTQDTTNLSLNRTVWLKSVTPTPVWQLPAATPTNAPTFGASFDSLGNYVSSDSGELVFCTHIRLANLITTPGSRLIRTEVRVFWPKQEAPWNNGAAYCNGDADPSVLGSALNNFHFVYKTSAVRQSTGFAQ